MTPNRRFATTGMFPCGALTFQTSLELMQNMATQMQSLYTGRSGHLAVMAKFLHRGYNTAIPEVDRGDDIFVVEDKSGVLRRIQVKAANGKGKRRHYAQFKLPLAQLQRRHTPELFYVFTIHYDGDWRDFLVIPRLELDKLQIEHEIGTPRERNLFLRLSFSQDQVLCGGHDLAPYRDNWEQWPRIEH